MTEHDVTIIRAAANILRKHGDGDTYQERTAYFIAEEIDAYLKRRAEDES